MSKFSRSTTLFTLLLTFFFTAALSAGPASAQPAPLDAILSVDTAGAGDTARVRVVHASPDAPNVDVRVDGGLAFGDLPFEGITDYAALPAGDYLVQVEPAGAGGAGPFVIEATLTLMAGVDYTVIATDVLAEITPVVLVDDNAIPAAGSSRVRFFHGSPDAPAVDITLRDGTVLFGNVAFGETGADYLEVPAGRYNLQVRLAGTDTVVLTLPGIQLAPGTTYTAYATGLVADGFADRTLYLNDDRFRVEVTWIDFEGNTGFGRQVKPVDDSGYFWFFADDNIDLTVKALDGRSFNGNYWFFYGSLSNVQYTITVTDTEQNLTNVYENPLGNFGSVGDTEAFPGE